MVISTFAGNDSEDSKNSSDGNLAFNSVPSIDGEKILMILLFRSKYRVQVLHDKVMNKDDDDVQLVVYQAKYGESICNRYRWLYSTTTIDGELILLFRLAYRVVLYQDKCVSSLDMISSATKDGGYMVVLLLRSQSVHKDDDTIVSMPLVVLYQAIFDNDEDDHVDIGFNINDTDGCIIKANNNDKIIDEGNDTTIDTVISSIVLLLQSVPDKITDEGTDTTIDTVLSSIVLLLQSGSAVLYQDVHDDDDTLAIVQIVVLYQDGRNKDDTIGGMQLVVPYQDSLNTPTINGEMILLFRLAYRINGLYRMVDTILSSIVLFPLQSIGSGYCYFSDYSTTTINGEWILLFRLAYRVERMYRVGAGKILSSIVLLLQSGSVHLDEDDNDTIMHDDTTVTMQLVVHKDDDDTIMTDDTTAIMQLVVPYLLFRSMYRVQVHEALSDNGNDDDAIMQLIVLYQDKHHTIAFVSSLDRNGELTNTTEDRIDSNMAMINMDTIEDSIGSNEDMVKDPDDSTRKNGETKVVDDVPTDTTVRRTKSSTVPSLAPSHSTTQNGENKKINDKKKYQLRALRSEGQYKDEVYNAEEGMFQEPILRLDYYLVIILMYSFSRTSIGDGDETTTLISTTQDGAYYKKIEEKDERSKEPIPSFLMIRLCLCILLIVTMRLRLFGQSMGSVKIHKDRVNQVSQTSARLESTFGSTSGIQLRTLESCIQSDVFVCSSLLKLLCSFLLKENTTVKNCLMRRCTYGTLIL